MRALKEKISRLILLNTIILLVIVSGCHRSVTGPYMKELDSISDHWVPDEREGVCDVNLYIKGGEMVLKGETNLLPAKEAILAFLKSRSVEFTDSLALLPDTTLVKEPLGLVNVSVCNMRPSPAHNTELISQALMGTPVKILKHKRGWHLIQTPDSYIGWVDSEAIKAMTPAEFDTWKTSERIIYLKKSGDIYDNATARNVISDIVIGSIINVAGEEKDFYHVILSDGRTGSVNKNDAVGFEEWISSARPVEGNLKKCSESFTGIPYLWGGTSVKAFDCSGFVKTIYYLNGVILARDASLQFRHGSSISKEDYPDSLRTGDLLFFGPVRNGIPRPTHVGMYIGDTEFIHASGMVKVNSLDSSRSNFSRGRRDSFLGVRRIIGAEPGKGLQLISNHDWYK